MSEVRSLLGDKMRMNREEREGRGKGQGPLLSTLVVPHGFMLQLQILSSLRGGQDLARARQNGRR